MKILRLLLEAYGPFTDACIDFEAAPSDLHLIYGPNEAGKSSALRAMRDLRYGIPMQSRDNFLHPHPKMRIGGVFRDVDGNTVSVYRRKGKGQTLSRSEGEGEVTPELELALRGGLTAEDFETLFGLDHSRLRSGGQRLLAGEGELGSALFEASAGSADIAGILTRLNNDANDLYGPRSKGRVNAALQTYIEQRRQVGQLQTRPLDWKRLKREHDLAHERLQGVDQALQALRRSAHELTELRTVEPLLASLDACRSQLEALGEIPDLPSDAVERRLQAEQGLQRARRDGIAAGEERRACEQAIAGLVVESALIEHGEAIERLAMAREAAQLARLEAGRQGALAAGLDEELALAATRISTDGAPEDLVKRLPSEADRLALERHLAALGRLHERLDGLRRQAGSLRTPKEPRSPASRPAADAQARRRLSDGLVRARALGEVDGRLADLRRELERREAGLAHALHDLGVESVADLSAARPLLDAQIQAEQERCRLREEAMRRLRDEDERLQRDLEEQRRRERQLLAGGEAVTASTLEQARTRRQQTWNLLLAHWYEAATRTTLVSDYEAAVGEADRQADLLRADAERVANLEDCSLRIRDMLARREQIAARLRDIGQQAQRGEGQWSRDLQQAKLPALAPDALREWSQSRQHVLELGRQRDIQAQEWQELQAAVGALAAELRGALSALGPPPAADSGFAELVRVASAWEKDQERFDVEARERARAEAERQASRDRIAAERQQTEQEIGTHRLILQPWHGRLYLPADCDQDTVKARLAELQGLDALVRRRLEARQRGAQQQAVVDHFVDQARQLSERLGEPFDVPPEDLADRLHRRLRTATDRQRRLEELRRELARARQLGESASREQQSCETALDELRRNALVASLAELPDAEQQAERKRQLRERLRTTTEQLAQASPRTLEQLRAALVQRDVVAIEAEQQRCDEQIRQHEEQLAQARQAEEQSRRALEAIDTSDEAAAAREAMEAAAAGIRGALRPWLRLRLAQALLREALKRFRERAQAPMVAAASAYFAEMTGGRYPRLVTDEANDKPQLNAERVDGRIVTVPAMSEGTADQLYLALRLAALELRRASHPALPLILDDVLITSDDQRAVNILRALRSFSQGGQVMIFTHHQHLLELARESLGQGDYGLHRLQAG